ncbi:hypothetical protein BB559_002953 [Furculomyces boomerangus]|uniref:CN hydrolase domain-containing protein n=1 Tax=Furculomyces boomerangus TaxID=61424 RepID=A0A2T9YQQ7_9FUNG|nr:hypothetical protein BB559_002953 [Furculomyces boomerangus]
MIQLKVGVCQILVTENKEENLLSARSAVKKASENGATFVVLPECFNCPYGTQYFCDYAETIDMSTPGKSISALSAMAKEASKLILVVESKFGFLGSIPEVEESTGKYYNTCTVWNTSGELVAVHRKVHLYDVDVPNKAKFKESDVLSPGNKLTTFETRKFPEMAMIAARQGCVAMIYPGAFNTRTYPLHWEMLLRASPAQNLSATYDAWGHSMIVGPDGTVVCRSEFEETTVYAEIGKFSKQFRL